MNLMENTKKNRIPLFKILAMVERGTIVVVNIPEHDYKVAKRISIAVDALNLIDKCVRVVGHHPCVINFTVRNWADSFNVCLEVTCV